MKISLTTLVFLICYSQLYGQQPNNSFIPLSTSSYGNTLHYHYSQSQWYYRHIVEEGYNPNDLNASSQAALEAMLSVKPKVYNKSILEVYKEQDERLLQYRLKLK